MKGRKIHALVDTQGLPLRVVVHSARVQDRDGAAALLDKIRKNFPWLELVWADGGYNAHQVNAAVPKVPSLRIEIVKRGDDMKGFVVLPRRWVVNHRTTLPTLLVSNGPRSFGGRSGEDGLAGWRRKRPIERVDLQAISNQ